MSRKNSANNDKAFALICNTFGRKFSFNAKDMQDAISKAKGWCNYHSYPFNEYKVEELAEASPTDLRNQYVN